MRRRFNRSVRRPGFDYASSCWYFVTICTAGRRQNLSRIHGCDVVLSKFGQVFEDEWRALSARRPYLLLGPHVTMPNHVHLLLGVGATTDARDPHAPERVFTEQSSDFQHVKSDSLPTVIGGLKSGVTRRVNEIRGTPGVGFWQNGYHDHVVRDVKDWEEIASYITWNPVNWHLDQDNPQGAPSEAEVQFWKCRMGL